MRGTVFQNTGNTVKWGKINSIFEIGTENRRYDITNALYFFTDQKSHTKTKIGGHLCPQGSKKWFPNHFWGLEAYF